MDIFDQATAAEERDRELALKVRHRGPQVVATGRCLNCDEPLPDTHRWCDADCRDDWQRARNRR